MHNDHICIIHLYKMRNWSKKLHPPRKTGTTNLDSALGDTSRCRLIPPLYFGWVAGHSDQMFFPFWPKMQHAQYHEVRKKGSSRILQSGWGRNWPNLKQKGIPTQQQQSLLISLQRVTHESTKSRNICKIHNFAVLHFQFLKFKTYCQQQRTRRWRKFQRQEAYRRGGLLCCMGANPLMDRQVAEALNLSLSLSLSISLCLLSVSLSLSLSLSFFP